LSASRREVSVILIHQYTGDVRIDGHLNEFVGCISDKDDSIEVLALQDNGKIIVLIQC
jgi:hypothetical protein